MMRKLFLGTLLLFLGSMIAQNLTPSQAWTLGQGSTGIFSNIGRSYENERLNYETPYGEQGIVWRAWNRDGDYSGMYSRDDGGWNTTHQSIDNKKDYRLCVWIKKTNSNTGSTYFGCNWMRTDATAEVTTIDGTVRRNPYFWAGDLPQLNRWYLLVGYIHHYGANISVSKGRMYDGVTKQEVSGVTFTDYVFREGVDRIQQRAYLYYSANTSDKQYFYAPRVEALDGTELAIQDILNFDFTYPRPISFSYDASGNRDDRFYAEIIMSRSAKISPSDEEIEEPHIIETTLEGDLQVKIYPNPTEGVLKLEVLGVDDFSEAQYALYDMQGKTVISNLLASRQHLDIQDCVAGQYVLTLTCQGKHYRWKIIKQ